MFGSGKFALFAGVAGLGLLLAAAPATATVITFELDTEFSGAQEPQGTPPWVVATFDDGGGTGTVTLTLETSGLVGNEFLTRFYFNLDPNFAANSLGFANEDTTDTGFISFTRGNDCCKADGDGAFDGLFQFASGDFTAAETWSIDLTLAGITANSFDFLSASSGGDSGGLSAAAHVQGINDPVFCAGQEPDCGSGWITGNGNGFEVPEPAPAHTECA
jgi:hypothetical protein